MQFILIPVKDLSRAKQRLSALMSQNERTQLARLMLEKTLAAAAEAMPSDRIAIVTLDQPAIKLAETYDFRVLTERSQISESASVDSASKELIGWGAESILRLPIDLPLITASDITRLLAVDGPPPRVVMSPSHDGTGTNALLRHPPDLFPSQFGSGSFAKHLELARRAGADCRVVEISGIALDIDEPSDIANLANRLRENPDNRIGGFLAEIGIEERLNRMGAVPEGQL